eukprot:2094479-Rhodomonas_salina.1
MPELKNTRPPRRNAGCRSITLRSTTATTRMRCVRVAQSLWMCSKSWHKSPCDGRSLHLISQGTWQNQTQEPDFRVQFVLRVRFLGFDSAVSGYLCARFSSFDPRAPHCLYCG